MRRFAIFRYLSPEQRERAARATYRMVEGTGIRTANGSCPLGVALHPDGIGACPGPWQVEETLVANGFNGKIRHAARTFIRAVDSGRIGSDSVAEALGVDLDDHD